MKFRVERDALADAVAWTARSLPARPAVPVLGGVLLEVTDNTLTVSGFDYEVSTQVEVEVHAAVAGRALVTGRLLAEISRALPPHPVDLAVDGAEGHDQLRQRPLHAADDAGRGLPDAARRCRPPPAWSTAPRSPPRSSPGRGRRRPGRHAADAHRRPARDRGRRAAARRHRPLPAGRPRAAAGSRSRTSCRRQVLIPARTLAESAKTLTTGSEITLALASGGAGEGMIGFAGPARRTTTRLLDAEFPKYRSLLPDRVVGDRGHPGAGAAGGGQAGRAGRRPRHPGPAGLLRRHAVADRRRRRRGPGRGAGRGASSPATPLTIAFNPTFLQDGLTAVHAAMAPDVVHDVEQAVGDHRGRRRRRRSTSVT